MATKSEGNPRILKSRESTAKHHQHSASNSSETHRKQCRPPKRKPIVRDRRVVDHCKENCKSIFRFRSGKLPSGSDMEGARRSSVQGVP
ncbi:hypothetical protein J6590_035643 [Homalodisca vitripennis]|nr:hypothetical protein J6590_035643 [Homalodisca vitripennis]